MSESVLGVSKDMDYLIISDGMANPITENLIMSELVRDFNRGQAIEPESITEAVFNLVDPKRQPSGVDQDVTHEMWPAVHSNLLCRVLESANLAHEAKHKLVESLLSFVGPEQVVQYKEYLDNSMDEQELDQRFRLGKFRRTLETACDKGYHNVVEHLFWIGVQDIEDLRTHTGYEQMATAHRFVGALKTMTDPSSGVALTDMFKTVDLMIDMGYDLETFQRNDLKEEFDLKLPIEGALLGLAKNTTPKNNQSIELMAYLVSKGADPWLKNESGQTSGDLIKNKELREQWRGIMKAIEIKDAAMDVLNEIGINLPMGMAP